VWREAGQGKAGWKIWGPNFFWQTVSRQVEPTMRNPSQKITGFALEIHKYFSCPNMYLDTQDALQLPHPQPLIPTRPRGAGSL